MIFIRNILIITNFQFDEKKNISELISAKMSSNMLHFA